MRMTRLILPSAALVALFVVGGCGPAGSTDVLATVGNDPITIDQFNDYLGVKQTVRVLANNQTVDLPVADTLAFQAMQDLVQRTVTYQLAKDDGVMPTDEDVKKEIEFQKALDPDFIRRQQGRGLQIGQIREETRLNLAAERLLTRGVTVTDADIEQWRKDNPRAFVRPATVEMLWVLATTPQRRDQVQRELTSGKAFRDAATTLSQAPNAQQAGGRYQGGAVAVETLPPALRTAIQNLGENGQTGWLQFTEGFAKFQVIKKNPEQQIEVTKERLEAVRRQIAAQRGQRARDLRQRIVDRVRESEVEVKRDALKESWDRFEEQLKAQAEAAARASAMAGQGATGGATGGSTPGGATTPGGASTPGGTTGN